MKIGPIWLAILITQILILTSLFNKDVACLLLRTCVWLTGVGDVAHWASGSRGSPGLETSTFSFSSTPGCVYITADKGWEQEGVWATAPDHRLAPAVCPGPGRGLSCQTGLDTVPWAVPGVALVFHCLNIEWVWSGGQPLDDPGVQRGNTQSLRA